MLTIYEYENKQSVEELLHTPNSWGGTPYGTPDLASLVICTISLQFVLQKRRNEIKTEILCEENAY